MTPVLVALAVLVALGGIVAVSAREPRFAVLGVIIVLVGGAYVADPLPGLVGLGARLAGAVLAGYLLWVALRKAPAPTAGWHVGWPGATALAAVAFVAGWFAAGSLATALGATVAEGPSSGRRRDRAGRRVAGGHGRRSPPRSRWSRWARRPCWWRATSCGSASACCCSSPRPASSATRWRPATTRRSSSGSGSSRRSPVPPSRRSSPRRSGCTSTWSSTARRARQPAIHHRALDEAHLRRPAPGDDQ